VDGGRGAPNGEQDPDAIATERLFAVDLNEAAAVDRELADSGIAVPEGLKRSLAFFLMRLREWNRRINLVAAGDLERVGRRHILESFNLLHCPVHVGDGPFADAGSGAGFPGIPLALLFPRLEVVLIESVRKKARFLARMVEELALGSRVQVVAERIESLATQSDYRERFANVAMRGLGPLPRVVPWCAPLLRPRGTLVAFKSNDFESELKQAMGVIGAAGLELRDVVPMRWGDGKLVLLQRGD
jgi:16S rRNA (guanine527-N7)-methyltransferase